MQPEAPSQPQPQQLSDREKWGNYVFSRESFATLSEDSLEFLNEEYAETGQFQDEVPLDIDWDALFEYDRRGQLACFSLRLEDGTLIGYAMFILSTTLHAKSTLHAMTDVIYVRPKYRKGLVGVKFIHFCEAQVKAMGAKIIHMIMKADPSYRFLERSGYRIFEVTYMKVL